MDVIGRPADRMDQDTRGFDHTRLQVTVELPFDGIHQYGGVLMGMPREVKMDFAVHIPWHDRPPEETPLKRGSENNIETGSAVGPVLKGLA